MNKKLLVAFSVILAIVSVAVGIILTVTYYHNVAETKSPRVSFGQNDKVVRKYIAGSSIYRDSEFATTGKVEELESKVRDLELRLSVLESKVRRSESTVSNLESLDYQIADLYSKVKSLELTISISDYDIKKNKEDIKKIKKHLGISSLLD